VTHLSEEYHVAPPAPAKSHIFRGRFSSRMPNDVGGHGSFTRWDTPLGSTAVYVERFRGTDDAAGELNCRQAAADSLVDLLIGWLEGEFKNDPEWPAILKFLEEGGLASRHKSNGQTKCSIPRNCPLG